MTPGGGVTGPVPEGRDPEAYDRMRRRALWSMPTGLFVVGSRAGDRRNLMTANWVMQVAITPKLVAVAMERDSVTAELTERGGGFSVSILDRSDRAVVRRFVKPTQDVELDADGTVILMQGEPVLEVAGGLPRLASARWWLACTGVRAVRWDSGGAAPPSHLLYVGEVVDVGERPAGPTGEGPEVLRMEDTRMNYGG